MGTSFVPTVPPERVDKNTIPTPQAEAPLAAEPSTSAPPAWLMEAPPPSEEPLLAEPDDEGAFSSLPDADGSPRVQVAGLGWEALQAHVAQCRACALHETRTQTVFGIGNRKAQLMVIGEAPGADEDRQGEPFVGRAGQLLTAMLFAMGLKREQVYIANVLKCRPPGNRDPRTEEILCCEPFLQRQLELVAPKVILAAGRIAAQHLLHSSEPVGRLRGRVHRLGEAAIPLVVTYHPAYLLRSPDQKASAWQDLQRALAFLSPP